MLWSWFFLDVLDHLDGLKTGKRKTPELHIDDEDMEDEEDLKIVSCGARGYWNSMESVFVCNGNSKIETVTVPGRVRVCTL
jgi:hypothetical protein